MEKQNDFKEFEIKIKIDSLDKARLYYYIFNTPTRKLIGEYELPDGVVTDNSAFQKIMVSLKNQGINPEVDFS